MAQECKSKTNVKKTKGATPEALRESLREQRIFYHNIDVRDGVRTRFPEDYEEVSYLRLAERKLEHVSALLGEYRGVLTGRRVLDVGCCEGLFSFQAARMGAAAVVGLERNRRSYLRACLVREAISCEGVSFIHGAIENFNREEKFEVLFVLGLLYHVVSPLHVLHQLHSLCTNRLFATVPVQSFGGEDSALCRLDRYLDAGHFWSFNAAFVERMFETSGFSIVSRQTVEVDWSGSATATAPRPEWWFVVAEPLPCPAHHVFDETLDEEFPPSETKRRAAVRGVWPELGRRYTKPVALFGAGLHTRWLLDQVADLAGPDIDCVLDDREQVGECINGLPVRRPKPEDAERFAAVLISSWHRHGVIERRCRALFGDALPVISLTSDVQLPAD